MARVGEFGWPSGPGAVIALRALPVKEALKRLGLYYKVDDSYAPKDGAQSERVHVTTNEGQVIELVFTGLLWFDKTQQKGAYGCIDLVMHLMGWSVREALSHLDVKK